MKTQPSSTEFRIPSGWTAEQCHGVIVETLIRYGVPFGWVRSDALRNVCTVGISRNALATVSRKLKDVLYGR